MGARVRPKWHAAVKAAYAKGYRVSDEGALLAPDGSTLTLARHKGCKYPKFSFRWGAERFCLYVHFLAAYCFHGEAVFRTEVVRHKNDQPLDVSRTNIVLGTYSENEADKKNNAATIPDDDYWAEMERPWCVWAKVV